MLFRDRNQAGKELAQKLKKESLTEPLVLALPRGGVPVASEIARALQVPLDVLVVRKIGAPFHPELGVGALAEDDPPWIDSAAMARLKISEPEIETVLHQERKEVLRRIRTYRQDRPLLSLEGRDAVLVDDGLATGGTARAAVLYLRRHGARRIILAVPVCAPNTAAALRPDVDLLVSLEEPESFYAVGQWYKDFSQLTDQDVLDILSQHGSAPTSIQLLGRPAAAEEVTLAGTGVRLKGTMSIPENTTGFVIFVHGSGSSRLSPRNRWVASQLNHAGIGTLLFDLLTPDESSDRAHVFDIRLLAERTAMAVEWVRTRTDVQGLSIGLFGASTGAAAALCTAAELGKDVIRAVVSRGGRPDLSLSRLTEVRSPTLLIVGGEDRTVIELNEKAQRHIRDCELVIVPGATHLFEEPGALEEVSRHAIEWFIRYLDRSRAQPREALSRSTGPRAPDRETRPSANRDVG